MPNLNKISLLTIAMGSFIYWTSFTFLDQPIANAFHLFKHNDLYALFQYVTLLGDPKVGLGFGIIGLLVAPFVLLKKPQNKFANDILLIALAMIFAIALETSLKYLLGRYRPELYFQQGLYGFHFLSREFLLNSSPSGHVTRVFVFISGFSLIWRKLSPVFILIGLMVALSRLVLEMHYLSDVIFGAILGSLVTLWIAKIYYSITTSHHDLCYTFEQKRII